MTAVKAIRMGLGSLFLYSASYKLLKPEATVVAIASIIPGSALQLLVLWLVTAVEFYVAWGCFRGWREVIRMAQGVLVGFILFLGYLLTLAHPPDCGCGELLAFFKDAKANALFGICRNVVLITLFEIWRQKTSPSDYIPDAKP